jgi:hypothetical protein
LLSRELRLTYTFSNFQLFEKLMRFLYTDQLELTPENVFFVTMVLPELTAAPGL